MNLNYFKYIFKKYQSLYLLLFLLYFSTFSLITLFVSNKNVGALKKLIYFPTVIFVILGYVVPIFDYRYFYSPKAANVFFSLPNKRKTIYKTSTYFHILMNVVLFSLTIILGIIILAIKKVNLNYNYLLLYMLLMSVIFISIYFFSSFICTRSSNLIDCIILNLAYIGLPALVLFVAYFSFNNRVDYLQWYTLSFIGCADKTTKYFVEIAISNFYKEYEFWYIYIIMLVLSSILHIISCQSLKKIKIENIGSTTKSLVGYRLIIPLYCLLILIGANYQTGISFYVVIVFLILCYMLFSLIAKRKLTFDYKIILKFIFLVLVANLLVMIF